MVMNRIHTVPSIEVTNEPSFRTWLEYALTLVMVMAVGLVVLFVLGPTPLR
jgi:hypothetical protein